MEPHFFNTKLGRASIASVFAMTIFAALSSQMLVDPAPSMLIASAVVA